MTAAVMSAAHGQRPVGETALLRVGGEAGEAAAVDVGEAQLRAGVRAHLADDDAQPGGPAVQVQQAGDVRDPGAVADLPVPVVRRRPPARRDLQDRGLDVVVGAAAGCLLP
jgi:hypothetical protein